jgi:stearoyl-CoA desaturase (delta-9 desaturase)
MREIRRFDLELIFTDTEGNRRYPPLLVARVPVLQHRVRIDVMRISAWLSLVAVLAGTVAGICWFWTVGLTWFDVAMAVFGTWFVGQGITIGYHRYFTHDSFEAKPWVAALLGIWGSSAMQGQILTWVSVHRRHHRYCDDHGDPHTPKSMTAGLKAALEGFIDGYVGWSVSGRLCTYVEYVRDLRNNPVVLWVDRHYWAWVALGWIVPGLIGLAWYGTWNGYWSGFFAGGAIRAFLQLNLTGAVNTFGHLVGTRRFLTKGESTNNLINTVSMTGEHLHNNHHAIPWSATFAMFKGEFDPGFWVLKRLEQLGLVWNLKIPSEDFIARRAASATAVQSAHVLQVTNSPL